MLNQVLLELQVVGVQHLEAGRRLLRTQLSPQGLALLFTLGLRCDSSGHEILYHLVRHLTENLLRQLNRVMLIFLIRHKLYNISRRVLFQCLAVQRLLVGIELVHKAKVAVSYANYYN